MYCGRKNSKFFAKEQKSKLSNLNRNSNKLYKKKERETWDKQNPSIYVMVDNVMYTDKLFYKDLNKTNNLFTFESFRVTFPQERPNNKILHSYGVEGEYLSNMILRSYGIERGHPSGNIVPSYSIESEFGNDYFTKLNLISSLKNKNYIKIIKDEKLFWALYSFIQRKHFTHKKYALDDETIKSFSIILEIHFFIEFIRIELVNHLYLKECSVFYKHRSHIGDVVLFNKDGSRKFRGKLCGNYFENYVLPFLETLSKMIGFECIIKNNNFNEPIQIKFLNRLENILISITKPISVPTFNFKDDKRVHDFTLSAYSHSTNSISKIKLSTHFLNSRASNVIKSMMNSDFIESRDRHIHFSNFDISTIQYYIHFLTLGNSLIQNKYIHLLEDLNIFELIRFAHLYDDEIYFNFCINIFNYFSNLFNPVDILEISNMYNNTELKEIFKAIISSEDFLISKIYPIRSDLIGQSLQIDFTILENEISKLRSNDIY